MSRDSETTATQSSVVKEWRTSDLPPRSLVIERYVYKTSKGKNGVQWLAQIVSDDGLLLLMDVYRTRREALEAAGRV